jgi:hypothetical protein
MKLKYELIQRDSKTGLYRVRALKNIPMHKVKKGDIGGFVASEKNLSQNGNSWIADNATAIGNSLVGENAIAFDDSSLQENACALGCSKIFERATIRHQAVISDNAQVYGDAIIGNDLRIGDEAKIFGHTVLSINTCIRGNALLSRSEDYLSIGPIGEDNSNVTFYKTKDDIEVDYMNFNGTLEHFENLIHETYDFHHAAMYRMAINMARVRLERERDPI